MNDDTIELWADREFGGAEMGDKRRTNRLVKTAAGKARNPEAAMSLCCEKNDAQLICRLFDQEEVTFDSVIACHKERTAQRCREYEKIFAVQDTTTLDLSSHKSLGGLGSITSCKREAGLLMHNVLAVSPDRTPLGLIDVNIWSRDLKNFGTKKSRASRPIEEKESYKWLRGKEKAEGLLGDSCNIVLLGDRESDIFELFALPRPKNLNLLVRATYNRHIEAGNENDDDTDKIRRLFDAMRNSQTAGEYNLQVPARNGKKSRQTVMEVGFGTVSIKPHQYIKTRGYDESLNLNWVWATEKNPPANPSDLIDWKLLTTLPVNDFASAKECVDGYSNRWVIEEYHRVLKSGCKIEGLQFETLDRMYPAMAICCVVAWRILFLAKFACERPDGDAALVSSEVERKVTGGWLKSRKEKNWQIKTVKDFVTGVAKMGGYLGRKSDGPPGTKTIWQGLRRLDDMINGYLLASQTLKI